MRPISASPPTSLSRSPSATSSEAASRGPAMSNHPSMTQGSSAAAPAAPLRARLGEVAAWPVRVVLGLLDPPMRGLQRLIGAGRMPYVFLAPNFLFFGLFVFL